VAHQQWEDRNTLRTQIERLKTHAPRLRMPLLILACAGLALSAACSSGASSATPKATAGAAGAKVNALGTLTNADGWTRVEGLRGKRYCEVLLARIVAGRLNAEVWNSYGLNDCPDAAWRALDAATIKTERGVLAALLNGPRYWLMDAIEKKPAGERQTSTFGTIEMFRAASVDLGPPPPNLAPYTERVVARETVFEYSKGAEVYEIVSTDGKVYVMQSYSQQSNAGLSEADLPGLATQLKLPAGWTYRVRTLDSTLRVLAPNGDATVVQDDFSNTYQLIATN
jgi:hypothetical protein